MTIAIVLAAWFVLSVPAGLIAGRLLKRRCDGCQCSRPALAEGSDVLPIASRCHACEGTGVVELGADEWTVGLQLPKHAPRRRTRQIEQTFADALTGQVAVVWTPKRDDPAPGEAMYYDHTDRLSFVCPHCADVLPTGGAEP